MASVAAEIHVVDGHRVAVVNGVTYPIYGYTMDDGSVVPVLIHGNSTYVVAEIPQQQPVQAEPAITEPEVDNLARGISSTAVSVPTASPTPTNPSENIDDLKRIYNMALDRAHDLEKQLEQLTWTLNSERKHFQEVLAMKDREIDALTVQAQEAIRDKMTAKLEQGALLKRVAELEAGRSSSPGHMHPFAAAKSDVPSSITFPQPNQSPDPFGSGRLGPNPTFPMSAHATAAHNSSSPSLHMFPPVSPDTFGPGVPGTGSRESMAIPPPSMPQSTFIARGWKKPTDGPSTSTSNGRPHSSSTLGSARLDMNTFGAGEAGNNFTLASPYSGIPGTSTMGPPGSALLPDYRTTGPGPAPASPVVRSASGQIPQARPSSLGSSSGSVSSSSMGSVDTGSMGNTPQIGSSPGGSAMPPLIPTKTPGAAPVTTQTTIPLDKWEMLNAKNQWKAIYAILFDSRFFKLYKHEKMSKGVALPLIKAFDFAKCKVSGSTIQGKQAMTIIDENNTKYVVTTDSLDRIGLAINCATVAGKGLS